jgi:C_GCAxxG_C_C family probable redox protein
MTRNDIAIHEFRGGLNCAQSVLSAYTSDLKIDKNVALSISTGFGSGMGRLQGTCGAVTGAFMAISVFTCRKYDQINDRKSKSIEMIQVFNEKFLKLHNSTDCKDLLGCNLRTPEGQEYHKIHNLKETVCEKCISNSVDILEEIIDI